MHIKPKIPNGGISIFARMTALANASKAINLAQGFPDFPVPPKLIGLVNHYMRKGMNQYAPMPGVPKLRTQIAGKIETLYGKKTDPDSEITITAGATQAIYTAITALVHEGDEVMLFEPAYDCYAPAIRLNGAIPVPVEMQAPAFRVDWELVKKKISHRTRLILINTPQNPAGTLLEHNDMLELEKIAAAADCMVLSDEVYEHILFDGAQHQSVLRYPGLAERSAAVFSFGKTYHNTGWKTGYFVAPEEITREFRSVHQFLVFSVNTPVQYALADFMQDKDVYMELASFYQHKRDFFNAMLKDSRFSIRPSQGTYFQLLGYENISEEGDVEFAERLCTEKKVASIPLSPFYRTAPGSKLLRFCFAKKEQTLEKAAKILCRI